MSASSDTSLQVTKTKIDLARYLSQFEMKGNEVQTHMWMAAKYNNGKIHLLHVPIDRREEFYTQVGEWISMTSIDDLQKPLGGENCVTEKIHSELFKLYIDIDFDVHLFRNGILSTERVELRRQMHRFITIIHQVVTEYYGELTKEHYLAMRIPYKLHIHYPDIIVNKTSAQVLSQKIKDALSTDDDCARILNENNNCVDDKVYNSGLRMLYMHKGKMGKNKNTQNKADHKELLPWCPYSEIYTIVDPINFTSQPFSLNDFKRCSILITDENATLSVPLLPLRIDMNKRKRTKQGWEGENDEDDDLDGPEVLGQPSGPDLMLLIKKTLNWAFKEFNHSIHESKCKINVIENRTILLLPLSTKECLKIGRDHSSNHQYLKIDSSGAKQKCFKCKVTNKFVQLRLIPESVKRELKELKILKEYSVVQNKVITDEERKLTFKDVLQSESGLFPKRDLSLITSNNVMFNGVSFVHQFQEKWCEICKKEHAVPSTFVEINTNACLFARCLECMRNMDFSIYPNPPKFLSPDYRNYYIINFYVNSPQSQNAVGEVDLIFEKECAIFGDTRLNELMFRALSGTTYALATLIHYLTHDYFACTLDGRWFAFQQNRWNPNAEGQLSEFISEKLNPYFTEMRDYYDSHLTDPDQQRRCHLKMNDLMNNLSSQRFKESMIKECATYFYTHDSYFVSETNTHFEQLLDEKLELIGFTNGVYDLDKLEFRAGQPSDCLTMSANIALPKEPNPVYREQIEQFFTEIQPDKEEREYMLLHLGSCLHGENNQEHYHVYTGSGRNGKSKLQDLIKTTFGDYFQAAFPEFITRDRGSPEAATATLVNLKGKRVVMVSEPNPNEKFKGNIIKSLTGNDYVTGRRLHSNKIVEFKPQFQLICLANDIPLMDVTDEAIFLRSRIVNFPTRFTANPKEPHEKLINENLQSVMKHWNGDFMLILIEYYAKYTNELYKKLVPPRSVMKLVEDYNMQSNPVRQWWVQCTQTREGYNTRLKTLQNKFREWYKENFNKTMDSNKFNLELSRVLPKDGGVTHTYCHDSQTTQKGVPNRELKPEYTDNTQLDDGDN
jgi:P4 family phage/plasmid primase-like protien